MPFHIVLFQPEIPQNTGNIARTCAATGASLHLVDPLGYSLSDRYLKRAGLDYWPMVDIHEYANDEEFFSKNKGATCYYLTKKAERSYSDIIYPDDVYFIFGRESVGLDDNLLRSHRDETLRIPMREGARCLNLSNSVAIIAYEYLRQKGFPHLEKSDHTFDWEEQQ
jgi:tRNA (cytidine/uridine-2'-O-)-methyltransferase